MSIKFGTPVKVSAIADRLKSHKYSNRHSVFTSHRDSIRYRAVDGDGWPGEPLPDTTVNPDISGAVMIRRHDQSGGLIGIVVGKTWREEGYVQPPGGFGGDGYLARKGNRVSLYEVALATEDLGRARLVLVHEMDLEEL